MQQVCLFVPWLLLALQIFRVFDLPGVGDLLLVEAKPPPKSIFSNSSSSVGDSLLLSIHGFQRDGPNPQPLVSPGDPCSGFTNSTSMIFTSPSYPLNYPNGTDCIKIISAGPGEVIRIKFLDNFILEEEDHCQFDYLEVRDGQFGYSSLIQKICGTVPPSFIQSSGRHLWLRFHSDKDIQYIGFKALIEFFPSQLIRPELAVCSETLSAIDGEIESKLIPQDFITNAQTYSIPIDCTWIIEAEEHQKIYIQFTAYELEKPNDCSFNFIEVYGSRTELEGPEGRIKQFCGSRSDSVTSKGNKVHIRFFTNSKDEGKTRGTFSAYFNVFRESKEGNLCDEETEFDCTDGTCLPLELRCNQKENCKLRIDEDKEKCKPKVGIEFSGDIILIALIGLILIVGMCTGMFLNIYRELKEDKEELEELREALRRSHEASEGKSSGDVTSRNSIAKPNQISSPEEVQEEPKPKVNGAPIAPKAKDHKKSIERDEDEDSPPPDIPPPPPPAPEIKEKPVKTKTEASTSGSRPLRPLLKHQEEHIDLTPTPPPTPATKEAKETLRKSPLTMPLSKARAARSPEPKDVKLVEVKADVSVESPSSVQIAPNPTVIPYSPPPPYISQKFPAYTYTPPPPPMYPPPSASTQTLESRLPRALDRKIIKLPPNPPEPELQICVEVRDCSTQTKESFFSPYLNSAGSLPGVHGTGNGVYGGVGRPPLARSEIFDPYFEMQPRRILRKGSADPAFPSRYPQPPPSISSATSTQDIEEELALADAAAGLPRSRTSSVQFQEELRLRPKHYHGGQPPPPPPVTPDTSPSPIPSSSDPQPHSKVVQSPPKTEIPEKIHEKHVKSAPEAEKEITPTPPEPEEPREEPLNLQKPLETSLDPPEPLENPLDATSSLDPPIPQPIPSASMERLSPERPEPPLSSVGAPPSLLDDESRPKMAKTSPEKEVQAEESPHEDPQLGESRKSSETSVEKLEDFQE